MSEEKTIEFKTKILEVSDIQAIDIGSKMLDHYKKQLEPHLFYEVFRYLKNKYMGSNIKI